MLTPFADDEKVLDEARQFNALVEAAMSEMTPIHTVPAEETRRARLEGRGPFPPPQRLDEGEDRTIAGRDGDIPVRVFVPDDVAGVYLHIHGGGWVLGSADQQDVRLWDIANRARAAVVSVEYRLAPEHPWPAGADDCEDAATWLIENGQREFGTNRFVVGGESAGAHLSAVTLLRLRDRHGATAEFAGANLVYGVYDCSMGTPSQRAWGERNLILTTPGMAWFGECFLPGKSAEERQDPAISPLYADVSGLPAALFTVGTEDPLLDDTLFMEARWRMAGNDTQLVVYREGAHGFNAFPTTIGRDANERQGDWIAERLKG